MKTSKLLLLTFVGLTFCITDVMLDKNSVIPTAQMQTAAKSYFHQYFPSKDAALAKVKEEIIKTTNEISKYEGNMAFYNDDLLTYMDN